jgi:hypothetical protein
MNQITTDLRTEYQTLADLAAGLSPEGWAADTGFYGWTPWDEVAHLCFFDEAAWPAVKNSVRLRANASATSTGRRS